MVVVVVAEITLSQIPLARTVAHPSYRIVCTFPTAICGNTTWNSRCQEHTPFDLGLAVILAGFAFESYNTPQAELGTIETDGYNCDTLFLSKELMRQVYQGQLTVKLKDASKLPGLDLWGTSDPHVWLRVGDCAVQSKTVWATTNPVWDQTLTINVADPQSQSLQVSVWDANILSVHRRLGNSAVKLSSVCDGGKHDLELELGGMGGGGVINLEVSYKSFEEMDKEEVPSLSDIFEGKGLSKLASLFGTEGIKANDFVRAALQSVPLPKIVFDSGASSKSEQNEGTRDGKELNNQNYLQGVVDAINQNLEAFGVKTPDLPQFKWSFKGRDAIVKTGLASQRKAEAGYVESSLAIPYEDSEEESGSAIPYEDTEEAEDKCGERDLSLIQSQAMQDMLGHMEAILGSWAMLGESLLRQTDKDTKLDQVIEKKEEQEDKGQQEEVRNMFKDAETAMEAWAILATSLGRPSFVKSEFEKVCFIENKDTDTQVAVWRDARGRRLVVAFRGTEQTKWKDLVTDLLAVPTGFNPERVSTSQDKDEVMVHTGFLNAYDSVRRRLMTIIKASVEQREVEKWHIYVTGHSLGGALATLLTMELSYTDMFKNGKVNLTMYNFGSPRVGNKVFAEQYNEVVKDSWRVVNHRDIIPTVPKLMGYCHVAQPIYLSAAPFGLKGEIELLGDEDGDVIAEATPEVLVGEFMKGEKRMLDKLLQSEITMLRAIRDGSALMQHMEDFYYISLLEKVSAKYNVPKS